MAYLLNYTRKPISKQLYDPKLAYSMHLAVSEDGREYCALNHNSGILYAKATENEDGSLNPKSLKNPWLFPVAEGHYGVAAIRIEGDGEDDEESRGRVLLFETENLTEYREIGLLKLGTEYIERVGYIHKTELPDVKFRRGDPPDGGQGRGIELKQFSGQIPELGPCDLLVGA